MQIMGLCGSLRRGSYNRRLLEAAARELPDNVKLEVYEGLSEIPPYNDDMPAPDTVEALRRAIGTADAVLVATPEYNASVPGHLKNALDWASRPWPNNCLRRKPAAVVGASTGLFGAIWAQAEIRKALTTIGARVVDVELPVSQADTAFDDSGRLHSPQLHSTLTDLLSQLVTLVGPDR